MIEVALAILVVALAILVVAPWQRSRTASRDLARDEKRRARQRTEHGGTRLPW